ncbi:MAG: hypothetical protein ACOYW3_09405 [Bacteroidota bacterium]
MKIFLIGALVGVSGLAIAQQKTEWSSVAAKTYTVHYTQEDKAILTSITANISEGKKAIETFFGHAFIKPVNVFVFPHRDQLDAQWQKDWGAPDFKSECWMVASGVAHRLDLLSPNVWGKEACEHNLSDVQAVQQLVVHEMVHVFHGQHNPVPDFTGLDDLAWLIEGVATYASGQLDETRLASVRKLIQDGKSPISLAKFWSGKDKYGLAGSLVKFVDQRVGREELFTLLRETKQDAVLKRLNLTEAQLIDEWKAFVMK